MIVDGNKIIDLQLSAQMTTQVVFDNGQKTSIIPARQTPCPDGPTLSLDGPWQMVRWPFVESESKLVSTNMTDDGWKTVAQPGKVLGADPEAESKSIDKWNRVSQTHLGDDDGAVIRRWISVPIEWAGKRIFLKFDAIYPAGRIYLNGDLLGEHLSGLTPIEFDVTGRITPGRQALVAVRLLRKHKFLKMDMVRHAAEFAGLAQSACLFAVEPIMVEDFQLITSINETLDKGKIGGMLVVQSHGPDAIAAVGVTLLDSTDKVVATHSGTARVSPGKKTTIPVALTLDSPKLWNDEFPNLYVVRITLDAPGQPTQTHSYRTGFRRLDLTPQGPTFNGKFVKFRGVNHLTYHPRHGMHTPREWLRQCLDLMKKANVNCVRTHFLGPPDLADLCDEMGLYLMQELPIDWGTNYIHDPEWVGPAMTRIEGGIRRDRHHASVVVWSVGNENMPESTKVADDGWNHLRIFDRLCKRLDPSRPTMFPPPGPANKIKGIFEVRVGDIADTHYSFNLQKEIRDTGKVVNPRSWEADTEECTREEAIARGWSGVWFSSEYGINNTIPDLLNNPYLSIIDDVQEDLLSAKNSLQVFIDRMAREWGHMRSDPTCLGGAYFTWLPAASGDNPWGWVRWAEDADWGIVTADLLPKPQFWGMRVAFSPVQFPARARWEKSASSFVIELENQFNSIDLKDCVLRTQQTGGGKWMGMVRQFRDVKVQCPPGGKVRAIIPIWDEGMLGALKGGGFGRCCFHLLRPDGFRVITADTLVFPAAITETKDGEMRIGPDAPM